MEFVLSKEKQEATRKARLKHACLTATSARTVEGSGARGEPCRERCVPERGAPALAVYGCWSARARARVCVCTRVCTCARVACDLVHRRHVAQSIEAQGIASFQKIVSEGISDNLLKWKGIEATEKLARDPQQPRARAKASATLCASAAWAFEHTRKQADRPAGHSHSPGSVHATSSQQAVTERF